MNIFSGHSILLKKNHMLLVCSTNGELYHQIKVSNIQMKFIDYLILCHHAFGFVFYKFVVLDKVHKRGWSTVLSSKRAQYNCTIWQLMVKSYYKYIWEISRGKGSFPFFFCCITAEFSCFFIMMSWYIKDRQDWRKEIFIRHSRWGNINLNFICYVACCHSMFAIIYPKIPAYIWIYIYHSLGVAKT